MRVYHDNLYNEKLTDLRFFKNYLFINIEGSKLLSL